ncbi:MAG: hypothetical protein E6Q58_05280 [Niabella sp.]|nr:MAG: hypothetical protein E6Q58_05280 [Niabella sp.]
MNLETIFHDKTIKAKAKVATIGNWLLDDEMTVEELLSFTEKQNAVNKATCIEAIEFATKKNPGIADISLLEFVTKTLKDTEPRVKWESAKVVANIAKLFPDKLSTAIKQLLSNTDHKGDVVRWATATALAEIVKLKTDHNKTLVPKIEKLSEAETDNAVKKKYLDALKKVKK